MPMMLAAMRESYARRRGMGFLDPYGDEYGGGGGGYADLPFFDFEPFDVGVSPQPDYWNPFGFNEPMDDGGVIRIDPTFEPYAPPVIPNWPSPGPVDFPFDPFDYYEPPTPIDVFSDPPPAPNNPNLPGYCPAGQYHPLENPMACVPFPPNTTEAEKKKKQAAGQSAAQQAARKAQQMKQPCPQGQARYPLTGACVPLQCPANTQRNPATGQCVALQGCQPGQFLNRKARKCEVIPSCQPGQAFNVNSGSCVTPGGFNLSDFPWWLLAVAGLIVVKAVSGDRKGRR